MSYKFTKITLLLLVLASGLLGLQHWSASQAEKHSSKTEGEAPKSHGLRPSEEHFMSRAWPDLAPDIQAMRDAVAQAQMQDAQETSAFPGFNGQWTTEGPGNIGARINTIAVHPTNPNIILIGYAAGGIYRTTNGGVTWTAVFEDKPQLAIGDIVFHPANPSLVWAATGDPNIGGYPAVGDGMYKSTDGGITWAYSGLRDNAIISKIAVHPTNTNILYAATMGLPFERNNIRGLYKSINGGGTWQQILFQSDDSGCTDVVLDPNNPNTVYCAFWNRIRNNREGIADGPQAQIHKSTNDGSSWAVLSNGLPTANPQSRIGLKFSGNRANTLFAIVVGTNYDWEGIYKTTDGGTSWDSLSTNGLPTNSMGGFGWYFGKIWVNPTNDNEIFLGGVDLYGTQDGGLNWQMFGPPWYFYQVHADKHDMAFLPNGDVLLATDGGLYKSSDYSIWTDMENIPTNEFYRVEYNPHRPTQYTGGMQDNGTTMGSAAQGINAWERTWGGDGFQPRFHPTDSNIAWYETQNGSLFVNYFGSVNDGDLGTWANDRKSWDMPYLMSVHNPDIMYAGTDKVYKNDAGPNPNWTPISQDLTDGLIYRPSAHVITALAESPITAGRVYVGTSDGNMWRSVDDGITWDSIHQNGLPNRYITSIWASEVNQNTIYVSLSGYRDNSQTPHIFKSTNNGNSWTPIANDLPNLAINSIFVLPGYSDRYIFVGTDGGVYGSINGGQNWERLGNNMPYVATYDLDWNPAQRTLMAGTVGKSLMSYPIQPIVSGTSWVEESLAASVYPTMAQTHIRVSVPKLPSADTRVDIIDSKGRVVSSSGYLMSEQTDLPVNDLAAGLYFVRISGGGKSNTMKFVKM